MLHEVWPSSAPLLVFTATYYIRVLCNTERTFLIFTIFKTRRWLRLPTCRRLRTPSPISHFDSPRHVISHAEAQRAQSLSGLPTLWAHICFPCYSAAGICRIIVDRESCGSLQPIRLLTITTPCKSANTRRRPSPYRPSSAHVLGEYARTRPAVFSYNITFQVLAPHDRMPPLRRGK